MTIQTIARMGGSLSFALILGLATSACGHERQVSGVTPETSPSTPSAEWAMALCSRVRSEDAILAARAVTFDEAGSLHGAEMDAFEIPKRATFLAVCKVKIPDTVKPQPPKGTAMLVGENGSSQWVVDPAS